MKRQLTYISLFSGAGVGCYGFKSNGFECITTNELLTKRLKINYTIINVVTKTLI